jgi:hypothetical protein
VNCAGVNCAGVNCAGVNCVGVNCVGPIWPPSTLIYIIMLTVAHASTHEHNST